MAVASDLPIETLQVIVDILSAESNDNLRSIKSLSLVSRGLLPLCRKHIFANIVLASPSHSPQPSSRSTKTNRTNASSSLHPRSNLPNFVRLLKDNPALGALVRHFSFTLEPHDTRRAVSPSSSSTTASTATALRLLTRLRSLALLAQNAKLNWRTNPLRQDLVALLRLPTLTHLKLSYFDNFDVGDLRYASALSELDITDLGTRPVEGGPHYMSEGQGEGSFRSVRISRFAGGQRCGQTIDALRLAKVGNVPMFDFTSIRFINVKWLTWTCIAASTALLPLCTALTDVSISVYHPSLHFGGLAEMLLPSRTTLRRLRVVGTIDGEARGDPLRRLGDELDAMRGQMAVEVLDVYVTLESDEDCDRGEGWGRLDRALCGGGEGQGGGGWGSVRVVALTIEVVKHSRESGEVEEALKALPERHLKGLVGNPEVDFQFKVITTVI